MIEEKVYFPCGNIVLEGVMYLPDAVPSTAEVVVCHPHPLYGGSMHNNVVDGICQALLEAGLTCLKFNFRGVGSSGGQYTGGSGETEDVKAAIDYLNSRPEIAIGRMGLCGYSAGAAYSLSVAVDDDRVAAYVAVSPPLKMFDFAVLDGCVKPKLMIIGGQDDITPIDIFEEFYQTLTPPKEHHIDPEAGHFWQGREGVMGGRVAGFFRLYLGFDKSNPGVVNF
ncbi:alpha/beta hydrolase [Chloroflexota bacterium]